jgi:hypothetical protein
MLQAAMRSLQTEGRGSPRKLITKLKEKYSHEFCYMLWEMVEPHETLRMDFMELNKRLQGVKDKTISLPRRFMSLLGRNSSFNPSLLSIYRPAIQEEAKIYPYCVIPGCKAEVKLQLPCCHFVCGLDCLAKIVAKDGFMKAKCCKCDKDIDSEFLHLCFKSAARGICARCDQNAFKYRMLPQCHHTLCRWHIISNAHDCPICHVPYDLDVLRSLLHHKCSLF